MQTGTQKGLATVNFTIDKGVSRFSVQAFATGLLSSFGHSPRIAIRDYNAEIQCVPDTFEKAFLRVTVQTGVMEVLDEMKKDDRQRLEMEMYDSVLDVTHFPVAIYESRDITVQKVSGDLMTAQVNGDLSFRGVVQSLPLRANITLLGTNLRITGDFALRQSDYGVKPVSFAAGALRLKDEVKFTFDLVAKRQD
jgi:polyisoprenoid-binding protein YceI